MEAAVMAWTRLIKPRATHRITVVDGFQFPAGARQRLGQQHLELGDADIGLIEAAARQWFRLFARRPTATLAMPSVAVDDLWHELVLHTRDYDAFCHAAFGHPLHPGPRLTAVPGGVADRSAALLATLQLARQDENCAPTDLPLLFRVDQKLGVRGGRRYLADCGGRGLCYGASAMVCLQHLLGPGDRPRPSHRGVLPPPYHHQHDNMGLAGGMGEG
jgi:hypothetical protein